MQSVAFVTYSELNGIAPDDRIAAEALRRRGVRVEGVVWDDPAADWSDEDCLAVCKPESCFPTRRRNGRYRRFANKSFTIKIVRH